MVRGMIRNNSYTKLIVLTTVPAVLLKKVILKRFSGRYIFDYRDYSFEKYRFYKKAVNSIVKNSYVTFLSSGGFYKFINKSEKTFLVHNISNSEFEVQIPKKIGKNVTIGFVGLVRYFDVNSKLIKAFANNENFSLVYHGSVYDDCDLPAFCKENNIQNVLFTGSYDNSKKPELYADIVHNGIYLAGGGALLRGLDRRLSEKINIPFHVAEDPLLCVAKGTGVALKNVDRFSFLMS